MSATTFHEEPVFIQALVIYLWGYWAGSTGTNAMQKSGYELMHDNRCHS